MLYRLFQSQHYFHSAAHFNCNQQTALHSMKKLKIRFLWNSFYLMTTPGTRGFCQAFLKQIICIWGILLSIFRLVQLMVTISVVMLFKKKE